MVDLLPQFQTLVFLFSNHVGFASDEKRTLTPEVGFLWYSPPPPPFLQGRQQTDSIAFVTEVSVAFAADMIRNADELCPNVSRMWQIAGNPRAHHFPTPTGALPRNGDRGTFVALMLFFLFSFFARTSGPTIQHTLFSMVIHSAYTRDGSSKKNSATGPARKAFLENRTGPARPESPF